MLGFQRPKKLTCDPETLLPTFGHFYAQPFERGFGTTVGNALRRALLSSIEGAAITAVKIEGVLHEFSAIPGVREDVADVLMNLKRVPLRLNVDHSKTIYLESNREGALKSGDIKPDPDVEILDSSIEIATVNSATALKMEIRVCQGRGYQPANENFEPELGIGFIPLDSVHSPVRRVNFNVEAARLGRSTDYDRLNLEVWTDGSISPEDAVAEAAKNLKDHLYIFINFEEEIEVIEPIETEDVDTINDNLSKSVEELELSVRSYNCLKNANIRTIRELVVKTEAEMLKTKNFGRKSLTEIRDILAEMGLGFGLKFEEGETGSQAAKI
jgi:DNA-directed RNA polymerase subunit alpha